MYFVYQFYLKGNHGRKMHTYNFSQKIGHLLVDKCFILKYYIFS